ncbi:MAG: hypothetical protein AAF744_15525 [Pseudomonadota bacterium]
MSSLRTLLPALICAAILPIQAAGRDQIAEIIANCTGRMSAQMEFAWLRSDPESDRLEKQRHRFVEILEAVGHSADRRAQMALRINAKMAHARLLSLAHFGSQSTSRARAKRQAALHLSACQNMLLDS